jgi:hypothetical protein
MMTPTEMQQRLGQAFNERQAGVLAEVIQAAYSDLVRTSDFNELKEIVRDLAVEQRNLAAAQQQTTQELKELAAAQQQTTQELAELAVAQRGLAAAQQQTTQELAELASIVKGLTTTVDRMLPRLARLDGRDLERRYVERAAGYFGNWLRQIQVLWPGALAYAFEQQLDASLSQDEKREVLLLDAILVGKLTAPAADVVYLALEASLTVHENDVQRVRERAALLRRLGLRVVSVVAGEEIGAKAAAAAQATAVAVLDNGRSHGWDEALAASAP